MTITHLNLLRQPLRRKTDLNPVFYVPVAGTWGASDGWVCSDADPFTTYARYQARLLPRRRADGQPWNWSGKLGGLFWTDPSTWQEPAEDLATFLGSLPYAERNLLAASHGGQIAQIASTIVRIRTLTTVGTPVRYDVRRFLPNIGYWQHIYDRRWDLIGTVKKRLGKIGDEHLDLERRFLLPGVVNYGIDNIGHIDLLTIEDHFHYWKDYCWFDAMRNGPPLDKGA
jgi:hypothetical protein